MGTQMSVILGKKKGERDQAESGGGGGELGHDVPITLVVHPCVVNKRERHRERQREKETEDQVNESNQP